MKGREKRFLEFIEFLVAFVDELNELAKGGSAILVEGKRDQDAITQLGYSGPVLTKVSLRPKRVYLSLRGVKSVIILTDLDNEGRRLAGRYAGLLVRRGIGVSLAERRRLRHASHGVFLHIENLSRFAPVVPEIITLSKNEGLNTG